MLLRLFLCFTLIPMLELFILIQVGSVIGGINTILLVIVTGFFGAWLARLEGMQTLLRVRASLNQGIVPTTELLDALIILVAGVVLITPGLITDVLGLLLLWPPTRTAFRRFMKKKFDQWNVDNTIDISRF